MFDRELTEFTTLGLYQYGTDVKVSVYKVGGGTVGEAYAGSWGYCVETLDEFEIANGEDLITGMPHTHASVAQTVLSFVNED